VITHQIVLVACLLLLLLQSAIVAPSRGSSALLSSRTAVVLHVNFEPLRSLTWVTGCDNKALVSYLMIGVTL
jgi:hypothetical protein